MSMKKRIPQVGRVCLVMLVAVLCTPAVCQSFLEPVEAVLGEAVIVTADGREIEGVAKGANRIMGNIVSVYFEDLDRNMYKFKVVEVENLTVTVHGLAVLMPDMTKIESKVDLLKAIKKSFRDVVQTEHVYFETMELPNKDGKYKLAQLLNPGFDSKLRVFHGGNKANPYLVSKNGARPVGVNKKNFARRFDELFGDCDAMKRFGEDDRKYRFFALHVFVHDQMCQ